MTPKIEEETVNNLLGDESLPAGAREWLEQYKAQEKERQLRSRVALALTDEVRHALDFGASWDVVIALATAAKHTLLAFEEGYFSNPSENLQKLAQIQGFGDEHEDGPFPAP